MGKGVLVLGALAALSGHLPARGQGGIRLRQAVKSVDYRIQRGYPATERVPAAGQEEIDAQLTYEVDRFC